MAETKVHPGEIDNPYKFRVYRSAAVNAGNATFAQIAYDNESYDTNNNVSSGTYTAPVNGYYRFSWRAKTVTTGTQTFETGLFVNGSIASHGGYNYASTQHITSSGCDTIYLTAGQTVDIRSANSSAATALALGSVYNYFSGELISQT
jgi:hypothetical protein